MKLVFWSQMNLLVQINLYDEKETQSTEKKNQNLKHSMNDLDEMLANSITGCNLE